MRNTSHLITPMKCKDVFCHISATSGGSMGCSKFSTLMLHIRVTKIEPAKVWDRAKRIGKTCLVFTTMSAC